MARNNSRKAKKDYAPRKGQSNGIPGWFWLLTGLIIGFLAGGILYLKNLSGHASSGASDTQANIKAIDQIGKTSHHSSIIAQQKKQEPQIDNKPRFDFYTMLPKMQVGHSDNQANDSTPAASNTVNDDIDPIQQHANSYQNQAQTPVSENNQVTPQSVSQTKQPNPPSTNHSVQAVPSNSPPSFQNIDPAQTALDHVNGNNDSANASVNNTKSDTTVEKKTDDKPKNKKASNKDQADASSVASNMNVDPDDSNSQTNKAGMTNHIYMVTVKGLQKPERADELKAQMLLSGYDVKIEPVDLAGTTSSRLILGPFKSQVEVHQALKALSSAGLQGEVKTIGHADGASEGNK